ALTQTERRVLPFVRWFIAALGYAPSCREIMAGCGISSTSVVRNTLRRLEQKGYLRRGPRGTARTMRMVEGL
ncbi:MAG TPA: repressor LexA, partial [Candidatus Krumholzibacteria bacterium]